MNKPPFDESVAHRWLAIEYNNRAWDALESPELSGDDRQAALHMAHASCCHWREVGGDLERVRALCLVANAEAAFGSAYAALRFVRQATELADTAEGLADWDRAFLADAEARALAALWKESVENEPTAPEHLRPRAQEARKRAAQLGREIADADDRKLFESWLGAGSWHGLDGS